MAAYHPDPTGCPSADDRCTGGDSAYRGSLGHARLTILGVDDNLSLKEVGLSELPSALLAHETGMTLNVYRPLAGRTIKDYPKRN